LPYAKAPAAYEAKFDEKQTKELRIRLFKENFTSFEFGFQYLQPWTEDFFKQILSEE
jgi:hypothetical protein